MSTKKSSSASKKKPASTATTSKRVNFLSSTKQKAAKRAGYLCSNPDCLRPTIGAGSGDEDVVSVGEAAHIYAAAKNGPRYKDCPSESYRKSVRNALWLCTICHPLVDTDWKDYPAATLLRWKSGHEKMMKDWVHTGRRGALKIALGISSFESDVARRLVLFLQDNRVLYDLYEREVPAYAGKSIIEIRRKLTFELEKLDPHSSTALTLQSLREVCHNFLDELGPLEERRRLDSFKWEEMDEFVSALSTVRKAFGAVLQQMSIDYNIDLGPDLRSLVPAKASVP